MEFPRVAAGRSFCYGSRVISGFPSDTRSTGLAYAQVPPRSKTLANRLRLFVSFPQFRPIRKRSALGPNLSARAGDYARERYAQAYRLNPHSQVILVNLVFYKTEKPATSHEGQVPCG